MEIDLTKREYFAWELFETLVSLSVRDNATHTYAELAECAVGAADALIKALKEAETPPCKVYHLNEEDK